MTIVGVDYIDNGHNDSFVNKLNADKKDKTFTVCSMWPVLGLTSGLQMRLPRSWTILQLELNADTDDYTYEYTVSVAKADSSVGDEAKRESDAVVVGIAISAMSLK